MTPSVWFTTALGGFFLTAWLAIGGVAWLIAGGAVLEAIALELAAVALAVVSGAIWLVLERTTP